jgi:hypothetical protein
MRETVFEQVWAIIGENYYDRSMNGFDWEAVRLAYKPKVEKVDNSIDLYWAVLRPMTGLLETSHVLANPPVSTHNKPAIGGPNASSSALNPEACGGLLISFGPRSLRARITRVAPDSPLESVGVSRDWRLTGANEHDEESGTPRVLDFISTDGMEVEIDLSTIEGLNRKLVLKDLESLVRSRASGADPATELNMPSMGITVSIGRSGKLPFVVDVLGGSEAAKAGIEPGSTFIEWHSKQAGGGEILFLGKFKSPRGEEYSATFRFHLCDPTGREATRHPGDVLQLRFDAFLPEVVPWLDEQLQSNPRAIILDLRRNGGGDSEAMQEILGRFLDAGTPIAKVIRTDGEEILKARPAPSTFNKPLAVLLSPLSASASEVSASALRIHERALLYGRSTMGNVLLAKTFQLADGGVVQVATADILSVDGKRLEDVGVKVDRKLQPTMEFIRAGRDVVLEAALADLTQTTH